MLSVRARTALGATGVVAVALVLAGFFIVVALRSGLTDTTRAQATAKVREVATQVAVERRARDAPGLDTDDPIQVVDGTGRVLAASDGLDDAPALTRWERPAMPPSGSDDDDSRGDDSDDRGDDVDDDGNASSGRGRIDDTVTYTELSV
ncbi:MAG TPA: hypothetical protein VI076_10910, partial [Actinopolymorphaceae bacterium]